MHDPFHLERFVEAQSTVYETALAELRRGRKTTHWMWFIFPQIAGLGQSQTARLFSISGRNEARAYLAHPLLGKRLLQCTQAVNALSGLSAHAVFGSPDDIKFRSSMTLFAAVADEPEPFRIALERFFAGVADKKTLDILAGG